MALPQGNQYTSVAQFTAGTSATHNILLYNPPDSGIVAKVAYERGAVYLPNATVNIGQFDLYLNPTLSDPTLLSTTFTTANLRNPDVADNVVVPYNVTTSGITFSGLSQRAISLCCSPGVPDTQEVLIILNPGDCILSQCATTQDATRAIITLAWSEYPLPVSV
jgi:hypothetical protein